MKTRQPLRALLFCLAALALHAASAPLAAASPDAQLKRWLKETARVYDRADAEMRASMFMHIQTARRHRPALDGIAEALAAGARGKEKRFLEAVTRATPELFVEGDAGAAPEDLLDAPAGENVERDVARYLRFLRALDASGDFAKELKRLEKAGHLKHPFVVAQKRLQRTWRKYVKVRERVRELPLLLDYDLATLSRFRDGDGTGWILEQSDQELVVHRDASGGERLRPRPLVGETFEETVFWTRSEGLPDNGHNNPALSDDGLSPSAVVLRLCAYAERLNRPSLALRLFDLSKALKGGKTATEELDALEGAIAKRFWGAAISALGSRKRHTAMRLFQRLADKLPRAGEMRDNAAELARGLESLVAEDERGRPKDELEALVYDLRNVSAKQWGMPGGISWMEDPLFSRVVERGWDVVPLLIEHHGDERPTATITHWRVGTPGYARSIGTVAALALSGILQEPFGSLFTQDERERFLGNPEAWKARAREVWKEIAAKGRLQHFLERVQVPRKKFPYGIVEVLLAREIREGALPTLREMVRAETDPERRRTWILEVGPLDQGLLPVLRSDLDHAAFGVVCAAAEVLGAADGPDRPPAMAAVRKRLQAILADRSAVETWPNAAAKAVSALVPRNRRSGNSLVSRRFPRPRLTADERALVADLCRHPDLDLARRAVDALAAGFGELVNVQSSREEIEAFLKEHGFGD